MLSSIPLPKIPQPVGEKRVTFYHLNWQAYQQILQALGDNRAARLTYNLGILEITITTKRDTPQKNAIVFLYSDAEKNSG